MILRLFKMFFFDSTHLFSATSNQSQFFFDEVTIRFTNLDNKKITSLGISCAVTNLLIIFRLIVSLSLDILIYWLNRNNWFARRMGITFKFKL